MPDLYAQYVEKLQRVADLRYSAAVLQWDQETYMPPKGEGARARQLATLSELAHERFTGEEMGALLRSLGGANGLNPCEARNVALSLEDYTREQKLPSDFVRTLSAATSAAFQAWIASREANDFSVFAPHLDKLVTLKRQEADLKGYEGHPYNALLNDYEKGATVAWLDGLFGALTAPLKALLDEIGRAPQVDSRALHGHFPKAQQWSWGLDLLHRMGLDKTAFRQDLSEHPFTTNFASTDVRVTTRISETDFTSMTWSCIHEGGHALYEQGLPAEEYGLPLGEPCSLSIHESQSRLWENNLGRSLAFWEGLWPVLTSYFPGTFGSAETFYKGINRVEPSLIRTEADELTYHFHILIRYELEKALIGGTLSVRDIPEYWAASYHKYLGLKVPDDRRGCLQDVHWSHGSFGYFPTYTLGSLYAAQLFKACVRETPGLDAGIRAGDYSLLLKWLREKIHRHGRFFLSNDLCKEATGEGLDAEVFLAYARDKYRDIYGHA
ncbi:carboxypeptidase M32 [Dinghuibacter silviterrae]|uniref:Metal-dependent carboxypeptidase n=1 Tax=Dinghuibacter silviterrae TaxID=1539049 RepID=A0A4R8DTD6_9BACT|nr:carboxypeptidase M32 [Dinghuibacter silviterrae]TDX00411.1 carboxypeptidase Taq [Dinghuibacter silviterrae]